MATLVVNFPQLWKKTDVFIGRPVTKQFNGNISQNLNCFFHKTCGKHAMNESLDFSLNSLGRGSKIFCRSDLRM